MIKRKEIKCLKTDKLEPMFLTCKISKKGEFVFRISYMPKGKNIHSEWGLEKEYGTSVWSKSGEARRSMIKDILDKYSTQQERYELGSELLDELKVNLTDALNINNANGSVKMNIQESIINRVEARLQETKTPCKSYVSEKMAKKVAENVANIAITHFDCDRPAHYLIIYIEAMQRYIVAIDINEMLGRRDCNGGYLGAFGDHYTF